MGVTPLAAHMFIFYFAIFSFITPPVAISAYAASGVAKTNAMRTGFMSFKPKFLASKTSILLI
jgi:TRAP-type uncharacterized transport system fused permease subunit